MNTLLKLIMILVVMATLSACSTFGGRVDDLRKGMHWTETREDMGKPNQFIGYNDGSFIHIYRNRQTSNWEALNADYMLAYDTRGNLTGTRSGNYHTNNNHWTAIMTSTVNATRVGLREQGKIVDQNTSELHRQIRAQAGKSDREVHIYR